MELTKSPIRGVEASLIGVAIAFFALGEPVGLDIQGFGLILLAPLVMVATGLTRRPWVAAGYLLVLGVTVRALYHDIGWESDVILVTEEAIDRLLGGGNPYGQMYSVPEFGGPGNPFAYPPGNLLYYLPGFLLGDVLATEVFSAGVVLVGLAWIAWIIKDDWPVAAMGLYAGAPLLIFIATNGSNDTSAGALLFAAVLLLLLSVRWRNSLLLLAAAVLIAETIAFKHYTLVFWPFLVAYVAAQRETFSLPTGRLSLRAPAWMVYGLVSAGFVGALCLPFFLASPTAFLDDLTAWSSPTIHPIVGWNVWAFLLRWQAWNAETELGDKIIIIQFGVMGAATLLGLISGVRQPSRALLLGAGTWFLVMLLARWTTFAYFAGVAPLVLLIPFADRLAERTEDLPARKSQIKVDDALRSAEPLPLKTEPA